MGKSKPDPGSGSPRSNGVPRESVRVGQPPRRDRAYTAGDAIRMTGKR